MDARLCVCVHTRPCVRSRAFARLHIYLRIENAEAYVLIAVYLFITFALKMPEGYVLIAVYLFIYLFVMRVIRKTQKVLN